MEKFDAIFQDCTSLGTKIKKEEYQEFGKYPIIDQGQNEVAGFTNEENGVYIEVPAIIFGDHTRAIKYVDEPFYLGADGVKLLKCKREDANYKYLYYALRYARIPNTGYNRHFKWLKDISINYPETSKQIEIVEILDRISNIIEQRKEQITLLDNLIKSQFVEMFGDLAVNPLKWKESQLIDLCYMKDDIKCGPFGTQLSKNEYQEEGVPLWGIPQINSFFSSMPTDYLSEDKAKKLEVYSIVKGDIVMSRKGNVGKCAIYPDLPSGIMHSDALRIRIDSAVINPMFLMHQLHNSRYVVNQIENVSSGAIMAGVNVTKLKTIFVHVPPLDLQNQFATFVQQVDKLKVEVKKSLDEAQILFASLMQKYFE